MQEVSQTSNMSMTPATAEELQRGIDTLAGSVAILEPDGRIAMVNQAWWRFAEDNGATPDSPIGPGANYLEACRADHVVDGDLAQRASVGIRAVLAGEQAVFSMEYPCHSDRQERWFVLLAAPFGRAGAMVAHVDVSAAARASGE